MQGHTPHHGHHATLSFEKYAYMFVEQWDTENIYGLGAAVGVAAILAILYELFAAGLVFQDNSWVFQQQNLRTSRGVLWRLGRAVQQMLFVLLGYLIMLAVMTMNLWLFISVIVGTGIGFFFAHHLMIHLVAKRRRKQAKEKDEVEHRLLKASVLTSQSDVIPSDDVRSPLFGPPAKRSTVVTVRQAYNNKSNNGNASVKLGDTLDKYIWEDRESVL